VLRHDKAVLHPIRMKDHLKHIPEYLIPASMRAVAANRNNARKKRKRVGGLTQEKKRQQSKARDPLYAAASTEGEQPQEGERDEGEEAVGAEEPRERVYTSSETLGRSTAGRQKWKASHKKGKFSAKTTKKNSQILPGSFTKTKRYK
jgi:hypothetical protein